MMMGRWSEASTTELRSQTQASRSENGKDRVTHYSFLLLNATIGSVGSTNFDATAGLTRGQDEAEEDEVGKRSRSRRALLIIANYVVDGDSSVISHSIIWGNNGELELERLARKKAAAYSFAHQMSLAETYLATVVVSLEHKVFLGVVSSKHEVLPHAVPPEHKVFPRAISSKHKAFPRAIETGGDSRAFKYLPTDKVDNNPQFESKTFHDIEQAKHKCVNNLQVLLSLFSILICALYYIR